MEVGCYWVKALNRGIIMLKDHFFDSLIYVASKFGKRRLS